MDFRANDLLVGTRGSEIKLDRAQTVRVTAKVAALLDAKPDETLRDRRGDQQPYWILSGRESMGRAKCQLKSSSMASPLPERTFLPMAVFKVWF
jgi:hypothetical protein